MTNKIKLSPTTADKIVLRLEGITLSQKQREIAVPHLNKFHGGYITYGQMLHRVKTACANKGVSLIHHHD